MAVKTINYKDHSFDISYEVINPSKDKVIVFLHGWGSNKDIMKQAFKDELKEYRHLYIDMPGFGKSTNDSVLTTVDYKEIIKEFLNTLDITPQKVSIAGHSFGGKVATLLEPKNLVLLSSAGILEPKPLKVKIKIKLAKILGSLGLRNITKTFRSNDVDQMSQNMYETFKSVVDEDFRDIFKNFSNNTLIFWGKDDTATSLSSGKMIHELIKDSSFYPMDGDHYFFLKHHKEIGEVCDNRFV